MLQKTQLFSSLDKKHLGKVVKSARERSYKGGDAIVREGESGVGFYLLLDGGAEVRSRGRVLTRLGPGEFFGEMTLLDAQPRSADVIATSPARCLVLSTMNFHGLIATNPRIAEAVLRELARRLRVTNKALSE